MVDKTVKNFERADEETAASLVEYALLILLIVAAAVAAMRFFGTNLSETFSNIGNEMPL